MQLILPFILIVSAMQSVQAGKFYVNQAAPSGGNGLTWASAFQDLQSAIELAQASDSILVAKGTYFPSKDGGGNATPSDARTKTFF